MKTILLTIALLLFTLTVIIAQPSTTAGEPKDVVITFYNANYASIFENRTVRLERGLNRILIDNIPLSEEMKGLTVFFDGRLIEMRHKPQFSSITGLLPEMIGERITLHSQETITGTVRRYRAGLLELTMDDGSIQLIPDVSRYRLTVHNPELLDRLHSPIEITVNANKAGRQQLHVFYITHSMGWSAEHRVVLNEQKNTLNWQTFAGLANGTSTTFQDATLRFFSGQINLSQGFHRNPNLLMARAAADVEFDYAPVVQESTGDHYLYTYNQKTLLKPGEQTQISLHNINDVAFRKWYVHSLSIHGSNRENIKPSIQIQIDTDGANGLNTTLPAGSIRFLVNEDDATPVIRGELSVSFITPGDRLQLSLGSASDITIREVKSSVTNQQQQFTDVTIRVDIKSNRKENSEIELPLQLQPNMELISSDLTPERDGNLLRFKTTVQAEGERSHQFVVRQHNRRN